MVRFALIEISDSTYLPIDPARQELPIYTVNILRGVTAAVRGRLRIDTAHRELSIDPVKVRPRRIALTEGEHQIELKGDARAHQIDAASRELQVLKRTFIAVVSR